MPMLKDSRSITHANVKRFTEYYSCHRSKIYGVLPMLSLKASTRITHANVIGLTKSYSGHCLKMSIHATLGAPHVQMVRLDLDQTASPPVESYIVYKHILHSLVYVGWD